MTDTVLTQIAGLKRLDYSELRSLYRTLHDTDAPAYNRDFLVKRIAYRIQEMAYGGGSEQTRAKLDCVLDRNGYDKSGMPAARMTRNSRPRQGHPSAGTQFIRIWRGTRHVVTALPDGFEYGGRRYRSLSAIASEITGSHWNGKVFFGANSEGREE
jgi:hypothetical protein